MQEEPANSFQGLQLGGRQSSFNLNGELRITSRVLGNSLKWYRDRRLLQSLVWSFWQCFFSRPFASKKKADKTSKKWIAITFHV